MATEIKIIYDNSSLRSGLQADWGFSCLISVDGSSILFDTGAAEQILSRNMSALGIDPSTINALFLSHDHYDHTGGIGAILAKHPLRSFVPASSSITLRSKIASLGALPEPLHDREMIAPHIWSTGELGDKTLEQALVIEGRDCLTLITGCAHPGIAAIVERVRKQFGSAPLTVIGGFHFHATPAKEVLLQMQQLRELGVQKIAPCHCTGEEAAAAMQQIWGDDFVKVGAGWTARW